MAKPEANFKSWLVSGLPAGWHAQTVETTTGRGVPDLNICGSMKGKTVEMWLELKGDHNRPMLRPEQFAWLMRRAAVGGRVGVLHRMRESCIWNLHTPGRWATEVSGRYVEIVSQPFASGSRIDELLSVLITL